MPYGNLQERYIFCKIQVIVTIQNSCNYTNNVRFESAKQRLNISKIDSHISQVAMLWFVNCYCLCITEFEFDTVLAPVRDLVSFVQSFGWIAAEDFVFFC